MSFEIRVNGIPFTLWKSATVQRSIDSNAGAFRFSSSTAAPVGTYPVKTGDFVEILINGYRKIAGFVDQVSGSQSETSHTIEVSGRDNTQDLIDSSVPDAAKVSEGPISLQALIEKVISVIGARISVSSNVIGIDSFSSDELQAAASGSGCMEYLVNFARKRQVYLVPDGAGGLIIYRPDRTAKASSPIIHKSGEANNNVSTYSFVQSQQDRFNQYVCRSQDNFGFDLFADYQGDGSDRNDQAIDGQIRPSRYFEFQAEESMDAKTCGDRAAEESNIRRALGTTYTISLPGVEQADGSLWDFGLFVQVDDVFAGIRGTFLIKTVEYAVDANAGTRTQLTLVPPDAYQVTAEPGPQDKRRARTGEGYQNQTPKTQGTLR